MFFTNVAQIVAVLGFLLSLIQLLMGLAIAQELLGPYEAAVTRYGQSGPMINRGIYGLIASVVLGTLAEISLTLRKSTKNSN